MDALLQHEVQAIRHALVRIAIALEDSRSVPEESTLTYTRDQVEDLIATAVYDTVQAGSEPALNDLGKGGEGHMTVEAAKRMMAIEPTIDNDYPEFWQGRDACVAILHEMYSQSDDRPNNT
jgi:hypothetical protein